MKRLIVVCAVLAVLLTASGAFGHLCDNVWRQADKLVIKPEVTSLVIKDKARFKIYMQSNMDRAIAKNVRLIGSSEAFDIGVEPAGGHNVKPGIRYTYEVALKLKPGFKSGDHLISFDAIVGDRLMRSYSLSMDAKKGKAQIRLSGKAPMFSGEAPVIDAKLIEDCWKNALLLQPTSNSQGKKPELRTIALLTSDGNSIYVSMSAAGKSLKSKVTPDPKDSLAVLLMAPGSVRGYKFKVTAAGELIFTTLSGGGEKKLDAARAGVRAAVSDSETAWYAELVIPVSALGIKGGVEGKKWRVNIIRENVKDPAEVSFWSGTPGDYLKSQGCGDVVFSR